MNHPHDLQKIMDAFAPLAANVRELTKHERKEIRRSRLADMAETEIVSQIKDCIEIALDGRTEYIPDQEVYVYLDDDALLGFYVDKTPACFGCSEGIDWTAHVLKHERKRGVVTVTMEVQQDF